MQTTDGDRDHASHGDLLGAIALGAVTPGEQSALEAHLAGCAECRAELARLQVAAQALPLALEDRKPPLALRDRIEAAARRELAGSDLPESHRERPPSIFRPTAKRSTTAAPATRVRIQRQFATPWAAVAALLLVFSLGMLLWNVQLQRDLRQEERPVAVAVQLARPLIGGGGRMVYPGDREVTVVTVRGLPSLSPGLIYELWPVSGDAPPPGSPTARRWVDPASEVVSDPADRCDPDPPRVGAGFLCHRTDERSNIRADYSPVRFRRDANNRPCTRDAALPAMLRGQ